MAQGGMTATVGSGATGAGEPLRQRTRRALARLDARAKLLCLLILALSVFHATTPVALGCCGAVTLVLAWGTGLSARRALKALKPLAAILLVTAVAQIAYLQQGEALFTLGSVAVTRSACAAIATLLVVLVCVMVQSAAFMRCTAAEDLTRALTQLLAPLRRLGLRVDALVLTLNVAFTFIPVLAREFTQLRQAHEARLAPLDEGSLRHRLQAHQRLFGPLLRTSLRRADQLAEALMSRCFSTGATHTYLHASHLRAPEVTGIVLAALLLALTFVL